MKSDGQRTMTYNYDNMPASVMLNGKTTSFVYGGSGNRAMKMTENGTSTYIGDLYTCMNGVCSKYIFAGNTRIATKSGSDVLYYHQDHLGSTLVVTDTTGAQQLPCSKKPVRIASDPPQYFDKIQDAYNAAAEGDTIQARAWVFNEPLVNFNSSISVTISGGYDCEYTGHLGITQLIGKVETDAYAGTVSIDNFDLVTTGSPGHSIEAVQYLPFGATASAAGDLLSVTHRYTSQEFDGETGLYNYHARFYNPALGKFISPDTIVPSPSNPQSLNRYSYVRNNPLSYVDPSGHSLSSWVRRLRDQENRRNLFIGVFNPGTFSEPYWRRALSHNAVNIGMHVVTKYLDEYSGTNLATPILDGYEVYLNGGSKGQILKAAVVSYGAAWAFSEIDASDYWVSAKATAYGVVGGTSSYLQGGDFTKGYYMSAAGEMFNEIYKATVTDVPGCQDCNGQGPNPLPGGDAAAKLNGEAVTLTTNNNFGLANNSGFLGEGSAFSQVANMIPGMNATAVMHDIWTTGISASNPLFYISMPITAVYTYSAILSGSPAVSLAVDKSK